MAVFEARFDAAKVAVMKPIPVTDVDRRLLKHALAAIAYRAQKAVTGAPESFADFRAGPGVRTPHQLVRHMSDVLGYARMTFSEGQWRAHTLPTFAEEIARFHEQLEMLGQAIAGEEFLKFTPDQLLQGPIADTMTHVGQLAMLRRLSGSPIPPENFIVADIETGNVGADQAPPTSGDHDWLAAEDEPW